MNGFPWIIVTIAVILVVIGILTVTLVWKRNEERIPVGTNFRSVFIIGFVSFLLGIAVIFYYLLTDTPVLISVTTSLPLFGLSLAYLIIGWKSRGKWR
jgi:uncharacterized membrane protein YfcA